jgi:cation transport ATPase
MEKTGKIVAIILWSLLVVSAILVVSLMVNIDEANKQDPTMLSWVNTNIIWSYILVAFGAGVAIIAGLIHTVSDKKAAKAGLVSLGFMGAVALVAYLLASPEIPQFIGVDKFINDNTLNATVAKWVDTGLYATYILLGISILSIVGTSVTRLFK